MDRPADHTPWLRRAAPSAADSGCTTLSGFEPIPLSGLLLSGNMSFVACFVWTGGLVLLLTLLLRRRSLRCARCQEVNRPGAVFCAQCGTPLRGPRT